MKIDIDNIVAVKPNPGVPPGFDQTYTVKAKVDGAPTHVVIAVDWEALAQQLVRNCLRNKSRKSVVTKANIRAWVKQ